MINSVEKGYFVGRWLLFQTQIAVIATHNSDLWIDLNLIVH
jgi:hypothetical protein